MSAENEVLEMMREVARTRIAMLKKGATFHDEQSRIYYLREYEEKLRKIDELIRRMKIRLVRCNHDNVDPGNDDPAV
jgi:transcription initiation factor IIE alpha subunit